MSSANRNTFDSNSPKQGKLFYGWWIVAASSLIMLYSNGIIMFGFTAVIEPIAQEFHWSYAEISLGVSLRGLEVGILAPLIGTLVDRWGSRRLVIAGSIIIASGLFLLSRVNSLPMFYTAFALISIGASANVGTVFLPTVANWFRRRLGLAIGLMGAGVGFGGLLVPVVTYLVDTLLWRQAMFVLAISIVVVVIPVSFVLRHKPERYGYLPDGDLFPIKTAGQPAQAKKVDISIPVRVAIGDRAFWQMALAGACYSFISLAVITHIMPYLSSVHISRSVSSTVALLMPMISIIGRVGGGWLGDRIPRRRIYVFSFTLMIIGIISFAYITDVTPWLIACYVVIFGIGWGGTFSSRPALLSQYYGRGRFGTILGIADGVMMLGQTAGVPLAGWVYDTWGSYRGAWLSFAGLALIGMILIMTLPPAKAHQPVPTDSPK